MMRKLIGKIESTWALVGIVFVAIALIVLIVHFTAPVLREAMAETTDIQQIKGLLFVILLSIWGNSK